MAANPVSALAKKRASASSSRVWIARIQRLATLPALVLALNCALAVCPCAGAQRARGPFLAGEIIGLLKSGVTAERVESLASRYGIAFHVTPQIEAQLRRAGASQELLVKLMQLGPRALTPPPAQPWADVSLRAPAGARIFIDSELAGVASGQGQLGALRLAAGQHSLRVEAAGYKPYDGKLTVKPGVPMEFSVAPQKIESPPVSAFPVRLERSFNRFTPGVLMVGNGRIQFKGDKGRNSFDFPLSSIEQYGGFRIGSDFYVTIRGDKTGRKKYDFNGPAPSAVLQAIAAARKWKQ